LLIKFQDHIVIDVSIEKIKSKVKYDFYFHQVLTCLGIYAFCIWHFLCIKGLIFLFIAYTSKKVFP
jgi:hypothetical protein